MNENNMENNLNNQFPNQNTPPLTPNPVSVDPVNKSSIGSIIGTIIVIAIIILGGLYFWGKRIDEAKLKNELVNSQNNTTEVVDENLEANAIKSVTSSDDLNSIEADLKATKLDNLDSELNVELE